MEPLLVQSGGVVSNMRSRFGVGLGVAKSQRSASFFEVIAVIIVNVDPNTFSFDSLQSICLMLGSCFKGKSHVCDK